MRKRWIAAALSIVLLVSAPLSFSSGCGTSVVAGATDLMAGIKPNQVNTSYDAVKSYSAVIDFTIKLFQQSASPDKNSLISPLCVLYALAMTANGADGNTLAQMEDVFGIALPELNAYLHSYMSNISSSKNAKLSIANSIWFRDANVLTVNIDFLQINADYYRASIYKSPFDSSAVKAINKWVSDNTDGMIDEVLKNIDPEIMMFLINAIAFDAKWQDAYKDSQVRDGIFTALSGGKCNVAMMYSSENMYLDDGYATGFIKYYAGGRYAFAALLPNDGVLINEYIATLTGQSLAYTLRSAQDIEVSAAIPVFESEYELEMKKILWDMGMRDAFIDELANLTKLGSHAYRNLFVGSVFHKTFISVDPEGTKAAGVVIVEAEITSAREYKTVHLDRPFVYMLLDCETNLPFFIGAMTDVSQS